MRMDHSRRVSSGIAGRRLPVAGCRFFRDPRAPPIAAYTPLMSLPRPRLRPLELFPAEVVGQVVICLHDPSGLTDRMGFLPRPAALAAVLCDGTRTVAEVAEEL